MILRDLHCCKSYTWCQGSFLCWFTVATDLQQQLANKLFLHCLRTLSSQFPVLILFALFAHLSAYLDFFFYHSYGSSLVECRKEMSDLFFFNGLDYPAVSL